MPELLSGTIEYSRYISEVKFIIYILAFLGCLPVISWICDDSEKIGLKKTFWTALLFAASAVSLMLWLAIPAFAVGLVIYLGTIGGVCISYIRHRNSRVLEYDRVLTAEHIKSLFSKNEQQKLDNIKNFMFITANNNEIAMPRPKTVDFFGYRSTYDLFTDAMWKRADIIVLAPGQGEYSVTYQVDGAGLKQPAITKEQASYLVGFVKNLADLDIKEKRKPQKGRFKIRQRNEECAWEVTTAGSTAGEQLYFRQISQHGMAKLSQIGLSDDQVEQLNHLRNNGSEVIIVSGPKKNGVTTTFYALIRNHDAFLNSIETLERDPAGDIPNITQVPFELTDTGTTTFAKKLQTIARMAPDIVGVSGCQTTEAAQVVCNTALKDKKLLYITLEADSTITALTKWIKLVGNKDTAIDAIGGIINQKLIRKLCDECKQAYAPNKDLLRKFNLPADKVKMLYKAGKVKYDKNGKPVTCENCQGTGFIGRTGIFEMVMVNDELKNALKKASTPQDINALFRGAKMLYLQEQALRKVIAGSTSINEVIRVLSKKQTPK